MQRFIHSCALHDFQDQLFICDLTVVLLVHKYQPTVGPAA